MKTGAKRLRDLELTKKDLAMIAALKNTREKVNKGMKGALEVRHTH